MRKTKLALLSTVALFLMPAALSYAQTAHSTDVLYYDRPASVWSDALPVGNGRIGAMVYGGVENETIQFNENTLYSGDPTTQNRSNRVTPDQMWRVQELLAEGKNNLADSLIQYHWLGRLNQSYMPFGEIHFKFHDHGKVTDYTRALDMAEGVSKTTYKVNGVAVHREVFASYPDQTLVIHFKAERPILNFDLGMNSLHPVQIDRHADGLLMQGKAPEHVQRRTVEAMRKYGREDLHPEFFDKEGNLLREGTLFYGDDMNGLGMPFAAKIIPICQQGSVSIKRDKIIVKEAQEVTFYLMAHTGFNGIHRSPVKEGKDPVAVIEKQHASLSARNYQAIKEQHIQDHASLYKRVDFSLGGSADRLPTDSLMFLFQQKKDLRIIPTLFQYGRYMMIAGSRPGGQPLNLQGIWNNQLMPPWNSGYTMNINIQMNYWQAEVTNLSECHEPMFQFIRELSEVGYYTAREMYDMKGWMSHHNASIWRESYPSDGFVYWYYWTTTGGWLCNHLYEHYLYSGDVNFLREHYPIMRGAAEFFLDWMIKDKDGYWVTPVGTSPENYFWLNDSTKAAVCQGPTMDIAIIRTLFNQILHASQVLNLQDELTQTIASRLPNFHPYEIGSKGQILEWDKEYREAEPQHRHVSHLYGLFPANEITSDQSSLFEAAFQSMKLRGNKQTGWSRAWKINLWARLYDGEQAYDAITNLIQPIYEGEKDANKAGLYRNLFNGNPFQIDANFGYTSGVAEMLLQSHQGEIHLLPALPASWQEGAIRGLKARGGYTVDMEWKDGKLTHCKVYSTSGKAYRVRYQNKTIVMNTRAYCSEEVAF